METLAAAVAEGDVFSLGGAVDGAEGGRGVGCMFLVRRGRGGICIDGGRKGGRGGRWGGKMVWGEECICCRLVLAEMGREILSMMDSRLRRSVGGE